MGPAGAKGDEGKKGDPGSSDILRASASGVNATNYADGDVLLSKAVPSDGGWLGWAQLDVTNTSVDDARFNCGLFVNGSGSAAAATSYPRGQTRRINAVGFGGADPESARSSCCVGATTTRGTFDIANVGANFAKIM